MILTHVTKMFVKVASDVSNIRLISKLVLCCRSFTRVAQKTDLQLVMMD